jgi:tetratricopeptide (TPR) repeat protein
MAIVLTLLLAQAPPAPGTTPEPPPAAPAPAQPLVLDGEEANALLASPAAAGSRRPEVEKALRAGDLARAQELLVQEAEAKPSPEVLKVLATVFLRDGRPLNAAIALKKAEKLAPLDEPSRFTLAMAYVGMGKRAWAKPELETLAAQAPGQARYPYWLARLDYDDNQYAPAVAKLEKAIALDPSFSRAYDNLGLCYEALGRFDDAQKAWERAIALNAEERTFSPWPPLNLGLLLTRLDRLDEAEVRFRESLRIDASFAPAHYQLGVVLEKKGRIGEARNELEEAARLDAGSSATQYALARLYRRTGEPAKADAALRRFEELKKKDAGAAPTPNAKPAGPGR